MQVAKGAKGDVSLLHNPLQDKGLGDDDFQSVRAEKVENSPSEVLDAKEDVTKRNVPLVARPLSCSG